MKKLIFLLSILTVILYSSCSDTKAKEEPIVTTPTTTPTLELKAKAAATQNLITGTFPDDNGTFVCNQSVGVQINPSRLSEVCRVHIYVGMYDPNAKTFRQVGTQNSGKAIWQEAVFNSVDGQFTTQILETGSTNWCTKFVSGQTYTIRADVVYGNGCNKMETVQWTATYQ